jgi:hypothetical protein
VVIGTRQLILGLQLLVGSLVTFGGTAYLLFAVNPLGTAFGAGHLLVGLTALSIGILALSRKGLRRSRLLGVNVVVIVYSLVSDGAAGMLTLLPTDAFHDSAVGTAAAVIISCTIVYLLAKLNQKP